MKWKNYVAAWILSAMCLTGVAFSPVITESRVGQESVLQIVSLSETNENVADYWTWEDWDCLGKMTKEERKRFLSYIRKEPKISAMLKEITGKNGGYLEGLENRCKTPHSLYEKMYLRPRKRTIDEINDILRYTKIISEEDYATCTQNTIHTLLDNGWQLCSFKNTWLDDTVPYKGINATFQNLDDMKIEIQFHTEEGFYLKNSEKEHSLYEQRRLLKASSKEYKEITEKQFELYSKLQKPKNIESLTEDNFIPQFPMFG